MVLSGKNIKLALLFGACFCAINCTSAEKNLQSGENASSQAEANETAVQADSGRQESRAEHITRILAEAYTGIIDRAEYIDGDWTVRVRGELFYYAEGRLLPGELREKAAEYDPHPFYNYIAELPPWRDPSQEEDARLKNASQRRRSSQVKRSPHFFDALWRANNRNESYECAKSLKFLGHSVLVHHSILEKLAIVEEDILDAAKNDPDINRWINSLHSITGWNWRPIADTQSRSFHSYGVAVDLIPRSLNGLETYWLWASERKSEWWAIPYEKRLHPPDAVIKAFEKNGFVWGGKWLFFDTMHFEYRPEILIRSGIIIAQ